MTYLRENRNSLINSHSGGISNILNTDGTDDKIHESDVSESAEASAKVAMEIVNTLILRHSMTNPEKEISPTAQSNKEVDDLIHSFNLQPHPEGGYYARTFTSTTVIKSEDKNQYKDQSRHAGSSIYYLLQGDDFSAWHRLKSDEMWHYYKGSSVEIHAIHKNGSLTTYLLGDPTKHPGASFQVVILAGDWFAAEVTDKDSYCFVGCTVTPAFEFQDFELANRKLLSERFPEHKKMIERLTRISNDEEEKAQAQIHQKITSRL